MQNHRIKDFENPKFKRFRKSKTNNIRHKRRTDGRTAGTYLYHQAGDALEAEEHYGFGTLLGDHAVTETGGVLRLDAEQEAGYERFHVEHARRPRRVVDVLGGQVAVGERDQVPDDAESQPAEQEAHDEHGQRPPPPRVHQRGEQVLHVPPPQFRHVRQHDVALAILVQRPPPGLPVHRRRR